MGSRIKGTGVWEELRGRLRGFKRLQVQGLWIWQGIRRFGMRVSGSGPGGVGLTLHYRVPQAVIFIRISRLIILANSSGG